MQTTEGTPRDHWMTAHSGTTLSQSGAPVTQRAGADGKDYGVATGTTVGKGCPNEPSASVFGTAQIPADSAGNCPGAAATETVLYAFRSDRDGAFPDSGLVQAADGTWYGTTYKGGPKGFGTVFRIVGEGDHFSEYVVYSFGDGGDGRYPSGGLIQGKDGSFYGTTREGGAYGKGTVFRITLRGVQSSETVLHSFGGNSSDGQTPTAGLVHGTDGNLYGTTSGGGSHLGGTAYRITLGAGVPSETLLYSFGGAGDGTSPSSLVQGSDGAFYGTTYGGGAKELGTVFGLAVDGSKISETLYHSFTGGIDGQYPAAALVRGADGNYYGTTYQGGANGAGTLFRISLGRGAAQDTETVLYAFGATATDGKFPKSAPVQAQNGDFYGTTQSGGASPTSSGTVYHMTLRGDAATVTVVHSFGVVKDDGRESTAGLAFGADARLYGTASRGGARGSGVVYQIAL